MARNNRRNLTIKVYISDIFSVSMPVLSVSGANYAKCLVNAKPEYPIGQNQPFTLFSSDTAGLKILKVGKIMGLDKHDNGLMLQI